MAPFLSRIHWIIINILIVSLLIANGAEFSVTFDVRPNLTQSITSGHHVLNGLITIPDLFVKPINATKRRLKEISREPSVSASTTPAPSGKLALPVIVLIPPEGAHDRSLSIYGEQHEGKIFDDLKDRLVSDGQMAVIQYDKRNCIHPYCSDLCPNICPNYGNACNLVSECYNDTNITFSDLIHDAKTVFINGITQIKRYLNEEIVDFDAIWAIPIGFSFQGATIATYIASKYGPHHTAISLMGSGVPIDELLLHQLNARMNHTDKNEAMRSLQDTFECIKNGTLRDTDIVHIENDFLLDTKCVKYWKDWLYITQDIDYDAIVNFMAINSVNDEQITPQLFEPLKDIFGANASLKLDINILKDINHYMINSVDLAHGEWRVDRTVTQHIITFINDICGYLDDMNHWIMLNHTNRTSVSTEKPADPMEDDTVYKILLYIAVMVIILILALGIYFICANKVCPYEFEDDHRIHQNGDHRDRERRRRRRRRHRRERERERRASHRHNSQRMVELNEPMIASLLQPQAHDDNNNNNNNDHNNNNGNIASQTQNEVQSQNAIANQYVD